MSRDVVASEHVAQPAPALENGGLPAGGGLASDQGAQTLAVIRSKVQPPLLRDATLERPRLLGWLDRHVSDRVVVISAEVGYGKSTLLADFSRRVGARSLWYRLERSDGDWMSFLGHLVASVREAHSGFGAATDALLRHVASVGPSRDLVVSSLLAELGALDPSRTLVILDDFHHVDGSDDVRAIMQRLIESAPSEWHFIISGRTRPKVPLGRIAARGLLAELTTQDLRFTRSEVEELFGSVYRQHLARESLDIVEERTEGWAASLQFVSASIAASRPSEVPSFIDALSGAEGPIFDFLAEEVLARVSPVTQRVLVHSSLLDRVTPALVSAILSVTAVPVGEDDATVCLREAEALGLLSVRRDAAVGVRLHPLLRQFLEHQLALEASPELIVRMHLAVARILEDSDWLAAGKHYAAARRPDDAMRVLGAAAHQALGSGVWGAATAIIASMPDVTPPPAVEIIRARALIFDGQVAGAIRCLDSIDHAKLEDGEAALISLARASALQMSGRTDELWTEVSLLATMPHTDAIVGGVAQAWHLILAAFRGGSITVARQAQTDLAAQASVAGLRYFAGVALHNEATAALAQGDYELAYRLAQRARVELSGSASDTNIGPSTLVTQAIAACEVGRVDEGLALAAAAVEEPATHPDVLADAAYLAAVTGDVDRATVLEHRLARLMAGGPAQVGARSQAAYAHIANLVSQGELDEAYRQASRLVEEQHDEMDSISRSLFLRAMLSMLTTRPSAMRDTAEALGRCEAQQAWRWEPRLRIIEAVGHQDGTALRRWVVEGSASSHLTILELAEILASALHILAPVPDQVLRSLAQYPARWLPVLTRQLESADTASSPLAARLVSEYGALDHAARLAAFERKHVAGPRKHALSRALVRRVSPTLRVHDLGRTSYEVATRQLTSSDSRRKAMTLLLYLVTRPRQTATREQVMEELWPDQAPASAINSLHQTLHFLRRDIAPWHEEAMAADYVPMGSEVLYLDSELVQIDSVAFLRQATAAIGTSDLAKRGMGLLRLYSGRFAPEFEYEDWAEDWRVLLHTTYLHLAHGTARALVGIGRSPEAVEVLAQAIEIDGQAFDLQVSLIRVLGQLGARDAALQQYNHFASLMQRELGTKPPSLTSLLVEEDVM